MIDIYWYHQPDGVTPIEETLGALHELVQEGTVRAIGSSNFTAAMVEEAHTIASDRGLTPFVSEQSEYSWLARSAEDELLPTCERLEAFATERGMTLLELAIGGLLAQPAIPSVIAGATKPEQVRANGRAGGWQPSAEDLTALRSL